MKKIKLSFIDTIRKGKYKWYILVPVILLLVTITLFLGWQITPKRVLDVVVIDKTVPAASSESVKENFYDLYFRKHIGFNWILNQQRFVKSEDKTFYDYKTDYFGPIIDDSAQVIGENLSSDIDFNADVYYISDVYGSEVYNKEGSSLTRDDIGMLSLSYSNGATVIGEMGTFTESKEDNFDDSLKEIFGVSQTGWVGRYVLDLADLSDVPDWAPDTYEQQYGIEWGFSGSGILLVSDEGKMIVLDQKTYFKNNNLLEIYVNEKHKKEFKGLGKLNFYNWFELIVPDAQAQTIASFKFNLNEKGAEKFSAISDNLIFSAVIRKYNDVKTPAYYFAGDFNDYTQKVKSNSFLLASQVYRLISFDRKGDVSNFYWNFYDPLIKKILNDAYDNSKRNKENVIKNTSEVSKIENNSFEVKVGDSWKSFTLNAFCVNGNEPNSQAYEYTRNYIYYASLIKEMVQMGGNTIKAYDLMPPEFYRAIYEYNHSITGRKNPIYILQTVTLSSEMKSSEAGNKASKELLCNNINDTFKAIHGDGKVPAYGRRKEAAYKQDVSSYVLGFVIDLKLTETDFINLNEPQYDGKYISCKNSCSESVYAYYADYLLSSHKEQYNYLVPVGVRGNAQFLPNAFWNSYGDVYFNIDKLTASNAAKPYFFTAFEIMPTDKTLLDNVAQFSSYTDTIAGSFPFGGYVKEIKALNTQNPILIDSFGLSTHFNSFEKENHLNGISEKTQGDSIVRMLNSIRQEGYLGGIIADLNDAWGVSSSECAPFISTKNSPLWHNLLDAKQTSGIIAVESAIPTKVGLELGDLKFMNQTQLYANEEYLYITINLEKEINYGEEVMYIGLDTYQRNDGEYKYDKKSFANSLSGMEYVIKFEAKNAAQLLVSSSYNRNELKMSSKESYKAKYDTVSQLVYGNFTEGTTNFYQVGSTIKVRIPWSMLNFTDPNEKLVINDDTKKIDGQVKTTMTDGIIYYLCVSDKKSKDTVYIFPETKESTGYRRYNWGHWEKAQYTMRRKESFNIIKKFFSEN